MLKLSFLTLTGLLPSTFISANKNRSDALGHIFAAIGKDWTHSGVASLYTQIAKNGYKFLYLTSRALGQAESTREYLKKIEQGSYQLPEGPVIMSPDRLLRAFTREVIYRRPEEFKMACLKDIKNLFPFSPFYAGFGNRITVSDKVILMGRMPFLIGPSIFLALGYLQSIPMES
jgi:phosphatidate phosphatase LPIN